MVRNIFWVFSLVTLLLAACAGAAGSVTQPPGGATQEEPSADDSVQITRPVETPGVFIPDRGGEIKVDESVSRSPLDPLPDEDKMVRGNAFVQEVEITVMESYPVQVVVEIRGNLPTPCHLVRARVGEPDEQGRIEVEVYSLTEADTICIQVIQPFETRIPLGSFTSGDYTIFVNGKQVGQFST